MTLQEFFEQDKYQYCMIRHHVEDFLNKFPVLNEIFNKYFNNTTEIKIVSKDEFVDDILDNIEDSYIDSYNINGTDYVNKSELIEFIKKYKNKDVE